MSKKKILFITPGPLMENNPFLYTVLNRYFTGTICTCVAEDFNRNDQKEVAGFNLHCTKYLDSRFGFNNLRFIINAILLAFKYRFKKTKIDLITTYDPLKTGVIGVICAKILNTKFAPAVNGVYTSPYVCLDEEGFSKKIKERLFPIIEGWVLKRANAVKILFNGQLAPFEKQLHGKYVANFTNLVDIDIFLKATPSDSKKQIFFAGSPFQLKGVDILIRAFKKISDNNPDWTLKLMGWFKNIEEVQKQIANHPKIQYFKPVFPSEMPDHMAQCSFFVLPSRTEAMGVVLIEAMACGKPRIGTNIDGIPTVIRDGIDGLLFELENADDLAEKMQTLIYDENLRKKLGENGRKRVLTDLSKEVYFNNLINFYNKAIDL